MIGIAGRRGRGSAMAAAIAVGIMATLGVDISQAASGSGPSLASAEHAYLSKLRPVAERVHNAMAPAEKALGAIGEPHAGDVYAVRDALIHGDALAGLDAARGALGQLTPPAALAKQQRDLVAAAAMMHVALRRVRPLASVTGMPLENAMNRVAAGELAAAAGDWQVALDAVYATEAGTEPLGLGSDLRAPASRTAWIFHADRSCSAASFMLVDVVRLAQQHTLPADEAIEGRWARTLSWLDTQLGSFPKPTGASALPAQLAMRLHTLGFNAKIFSRLRTAIQHGDVARIDRLLNQLDQVRATLIAFSGDLRRYGATSCALVIGQWAGKPIGPQGHRRSVST